MVSSQGVLITCFQGWGAHYLSMQPIYSEVGQFCLLESSLLFQTEIYLLSPGNIHPLA